jgi:F-type H+-transporting ATPase subunit b
MMRKSFPAIVLGVAMLCGVAAVGGGDCVAAAEPAKEAPPGNSAAENPAANHGESEHGHPGKVEVPLSFKADLAFWSGITFVIFLIVLGRFAWKPLIEALNKRESQIRGDIAQAEAARLKAEAMLAEHAKAMAKVQDEVRGILAEGRRDAEQAKRDILAEAQKQADATAQRAQEDIGRARDTALKDLFDVMADQVAHATEHVLGRSVNDSDQHRLIEEALAQFPKS